MFSASAGGLTLVHLVTFLAMESSEGLSCSREGYGWGLEGENSTPKLLVCVEISSQADGTHGCCGKNTRFQIITLREGRESLLSPTAPM